MSTRGDTTLGFRSLDRNGSKNPSSGKVACFVLVHDPTAPQIATAVVILRKSLFIAESNVRVVILKPEISWL